jgi:hypothetical protein
MFGVFPDVRIQDCSIWDWVRTGLILLLAACKYFTTSASHVYQEGI